MSQWHYLPKSLALEKITSCSKHPDAFVFISFYLIRVRCIHCAVCTEKCCAALPNNVEAFRCLFRSKASLCRKCIRVCCFPLSNIRLLTVKINFLLFYFRKITKFFVLFFFVVEEFNIYVWFKASLRVIILLKDFQWKINTITNELRFHLRWLQKRIHLCFGKLSNSIQKSCSTAPNDAHK